MYIRRLQLYFHIGQHRATQTNSASGTLPTFAPGQSRTSNEQRTLPSATINYQLLIVNCQPIINTAVNCSVIVHKSPSPMPGGKAKHYVRPRGWTRRIQAHKSRKMTGETSELRRTGSRICAPKPAVKEKI